MYCTDFLAVSPLQGGQIFFFHRWPEPTTDGPLHDHNVRVLLNLTIRIPTSLKPFLRDVIAAVAAIPFRRQPGPTRFKSV